MKFVLFVEGETEQKVLPAFLKKWLDPQLSQRVGIQPVLFVGWSELVKNLVKRAHAHLNGPDKNDIIAVIGLLDLYGPDFYPDDKTTAKERYDWAKAKFEAEVNHLKFRQHFAVHECEAWLLSDPTLLPSEVSKKLPPSCSKPETVNFNQPPKKLLHKLYRDKLQTTYKEVTHGSGLFADLDPNLARSKCPQFKAMLDDMLALAKAAGL
jgi:predicted ATP-dependent endonuclease of OLD family